MTDDASIGRNIGELLDQLDDDTLDMLSGAASPQLVAQINRAFAVKLRECRQQHHQTPVAVGGSRARGAKLGYFEERLRDGTLGFYMRRADDCLQAAVASCLQPPHTVPDLHIDAKLAAGKDPEHITRWSWQKMVAWADQRGVSIIVHPQPPISERRWIAVVAEPGRFNDHCLLMHKRERLFDPTSRPDRPEDPHANLDIDYGITLRKE